MKHLIAIGVWVVLLVTRTAAAAADEVPRTFPTPDAAVAALADAARNHDWTGLRALFGMATDELVATDRVQATNELGNFAEAFAAHHRLLEETATRRVLEVGTHAWPFPVPLVQQHGRWRFDLEAGQEELLNRRIGRNELAVLNVMRVYVEAQREYASRDRDGDRVLEYAQRLGSSPGTKDGLFWPPDLDGELSPLGPLVARAQTEGYALDDPEAGDAREPFHGYYFKLLTRQGRHAPGGKYNYVINGNMIGGFALVAWPADYGESGVMSFLVNQQGRVYQRDLGSNTARKASRMTAYDPGPGWQVSPD
ncbi:MAG: DUF2950 domain-containing protein [Verrucomicrobiae bacterium]|nr:DUF2950 domain-containing protein [Verrucomicrobiae bacterium]